MVVAGLRVANPEALRCFQDAFVRGTRAQLVTVSVDAGGAGSVLIYRPGPPFGEAGGAASFGAIELDLDGFEVTGRPHHYACSGLLLSPTHLELHNCRGPSPFWEEMNERDVLRAMVPGAPILCGIEVRAQRPADRNVDGLQCLVEAFERGRPAQLISIDLRDGDQPRSEVITAYEPGVLHVFRDTASGMTRVRCNGIEWFDGAELMELVGCT